MRRGGRCARGERCPCAIVAPCEPLVVPADPAAARRACTQRKRGRSCCLEARLSVLTPFCPSRRAPCECALTCCRPLCVLLVQAFARLSLVRRQLAAAVQDEDYARAAALRDERTSLLEGLPARLQFCVARLEAMKDEEASLAARCEAAQALGNIGDAALIASELAAWLSRAEGEPTALVEAVEAALWAQWMHPPEMHPDAAALGVAMERGCAHLAAPGGVELDQAVEVFSDVIREVPTFAEAINKRATALYLMGELRRAAADCKTVLALNPAHFGAASGMGMCLLRLGRVEEAKAAFETALAANPSLGAIRQYVSAIERAEAQQQE